MQRRAVAVYAAFFILIAAASYTLIATAEEPTITLEDADYELSENETFVIGGQEYTVTGIEETEADDGSLSFVGSIEWIEADVDQSETWANEQTVTVDDTDWEVQLDTEAEAPTSFTLVEILDRQAILEADPSAGNETVERDGEEFVIVGTNGGEELVAAEEYFDEPRTITINEGNQFTYNGETATVAAVTVDGVSLTWTADETNSEDLQQGELTELADGNEYLSFFPGDSTMLLTQDTSSYDAQVESQQAFADRITGLRYTTFTTVFFALSLIAFAYLPSRY